MFRLQGHLDKQKQETHNHRFINFDEVTNDLRKFAETFNSYATRKTFATGFLNIALVGSYFRLFICFLTNLNTMQIQITTKQQM